MIVGPTRALFMDEISNGLDSSTTYQIVSCLQQLVHITEITALVSLLQPAPETFELFDDIILMTEGNIIYHGPRTLVLEFFEDCGFRCPERKSIADFLHSLFLNRERKALVEQLSKPETSSKNLQFVTRFPQNGWEQYKACLWKQNLSYWRCPTYNLACLIYMVVVSVTFGAAFWQHGKNIKYEQDVFNMLGSMFLPLVFAGVNISTTVLSTVATERIILYRERFAGMYSSWAYSFAQMTVEVPYKLLQTVIFVGIIYPSIGYYWSAYKVFWFFYAIFCSLLSATYLGMLLMSVCPNSVVASILAAACYTLLNLFSGYLLPRPEIPKWWIWLYWICPTSWTLNGLLTSQYGDIDDEITAYGEAKPLNYFLQDYYGYRREQLGLVAFMIACYPIVFSILFAYFTGKLNFQRR